MKQAKKERKKKKREQFAKDIKANTNKHQKQKTAR